MSQSNSCQILHDVFSRGRRCTRPYDAYATITRFVDNANETLLYQQMAEPSATDDMIWAKAVLTNERVSKDPPSLRNPQQDGTEDVGR